MVREWINLDDDIKEKRTEMKGLTTRHKKLKEVIRTRMVESGVDTLNVSDTGDTLELKERKSRAKPKKPVIVKRLGDFLKDPELASKAWDYATEPAAASTTIGLTRKRPKI